MTLNNKINQRAFTLVEVLLALGIFSIVAVLVSSVFWSAIRLNRQSESHKEVYGQARQTFDLIAKELENAVNYNFSASYPDKRVFEGLENKISFITRIDGRLKRIAYYLTSPEESDLYQILINEATDKNVTINSGLATSDRSFYLVRTQQDLVDYFNDSAEEEIEEEVISTGIAPDGLVFSYGNRQKDELGGIEWEEDWESTGIPTQVGLIVKILPPDENEQSDPLIFNRNVIIPQGVLGGAASE